MSVDIVGPRKKPTLAMSLRIKDLARRGILQSVPARINNDNDEGTHALEKMKSIINKQDGQTDTEKKEKKPDRGLADLGWGWGEI